MKLLWTLQTDNQPRQLHNLFPPLIVSDVATAARAARDCGRRRRLRQHLRHRRREGHADLEAAFRQHVRGAGRRPRRRTAVPGRADRDAGRSRPTDDAGQVQGLRDLLGRPAAAARRRDRRGPRAAEPFLPPNGKPYALNLVQQRALHHDRAGLRRQSEPVLRLRPGDEEGRQLQSRAAAACGRGSGRRSARTARSTPAAATATTTPSSRSTARRSSA